MRFFSEYNFNLKLVPIWNLFHFGIIIQILIIKNGEFSMANNKKICLITGGVQVLVSRFPKFLPSRILK